MANSELRILHIRSSGGFYGAESVILNLANEGRALGAESAILCLNNTKNPHTELVQRASDEGLPADTVDCRGLYDRDCVRMIRQKLIDGGFTHIHSHDYKSDIYAVLAARGLPVKKSATVHGYMPNSLKLRFYETLDRFILKQFFDHVFLVSQEQCRHFRGANVRVIPNGIDVNKFKRTPLPIPPHEGEGLDNRNKNTDKKFSLPQVRRAREGGLSAPYFTITNIARLSKEKDQATLLKGFEILKGRIANSKSRINKKNRQIENSEWRIDKPQPFTIHHSPFASNKLCLLLVGDGPERNRLIQLCAELGLSYSVLQDASCEVPDAKCQMLTANHKADVIFLGERSDIPDILAASDVFVLSSTREGLPMTILEAMAAEVPIVTTPAGGIPDVIKDGLTGLVVDFGDDHGLAAAFNTIRENPSAAREMAARAFDLVQSEYSSRAMTKKYLAIE